MALAVSSCSLIPEGALDYKMCQSGPSLASPRVPSTSLCESVSGHCPVLEVNGPRLVEGSSLEEGVAVSR